MERRILVLNGPNLGKLGSREKEFYGSLDYPLLEEFITDCARALRVEVEIRQSDDEATIVGWLHEAMDESIPVVLLWHSRTIQWRYEMLVPCFELH